MSESHSERERVTVCHRCACLSLLHNQQQGIQSKNQLQIAQSNLNLHPFASALEKLQVGKLIDSYEVQTRLSGKGYQ